MAVDGVSSHFAYGHEEGRGDCGMGAQDLRVGMATRARDMGHRDAFCRA